MGAFRRCRHHSPFRLASTPLNLPIICTIGGMSTAISIPGLFTTLEAAEILGLDHSMVCRYCRSGRLKAEKLGNMWLIRKPALDAFKRQPRDVGNPSSRRG